MAELTFFYGNSQEVANQINPYIKAGATHLDILDMLPLVLEPEDSYEGLTRQLQVCKRLKTGA
jgi:hypothetical protein